ncbi:Hypothetical protein R9X50_00186700 [Acrodontium crateriforme]|uniref:DUF1682-domain-containing protein n=1 Tax=Acrodontium crateriforme TaxID=150365 RepID=A0AAQ3M2T5_9PEZI|nr:Hypothetical protein R9X50_00186700 [Acrodontium crateriforme]
MAEYLQKILGGADAAVSSALSSDIDADFADFATAASPVAPAHAATSSLGAPTIAPVAASGGRYSTEGRPFTKWYRVWERVTIDDFRQELIILPALIVMILINLWGSRANKKRARQWGGAHFPLLESEFSSVGFSGKPTTDVAIPSEGFLREKSKSEYITYATGRQNVAWIDVKLSLYPRYNPAKWITEAGIAFFVDSMPAPTERIESTIYCFDGKEKSYVAAPGPQAKDSSYAGFVWAIVHKDKMTQLRNDRYDISLTATKDHPKLPIWATIMSESAEITETLLTPELIKAVEDVGEDLEALIISDQPIDAPRTLNDTVPRKRISLATRLPNSDEATEKSTKLYNIFLRLPDTLVNTAHFRPEALRKVRATREEEQAKIRKRDDEEKAEERRALSDKAKKEERDKKLARMTDAEQKKFLDKERAADQKKQQKKMTMRG